MTDPNANDRGEYGLGPEPAPNPRPFGAPRVRINTTMMGYDAPAPGRPIPYARPMPAQEAEPNVPTATQYIIGGISPFAYAMLVGVVMHVLTLARLPMVAQELLVWAAFGGFAALVIFVHVKLGWKGFLPGVLTAVFVIPLVLFAICGVVLLGIGAASGGFR
jgi:hypothetical protein